MATGGLNQTATPNPVVDFAPQKTYVSFSGLINQTFNPVTYTGTTNTLTFADVLGGLIILTNGSAITATLPTAALLVPQIQGAEGGTFLGINAAGGSGIDFEIKAGGAGAVTVSVGTGGTLVGTGAITAGNVKRFRLIVTDAGSTPTYTVYSLGQSAQ